MQLPAASGLTAGEALLGCVCFTFVDYLFSLLYIRFAGAHGSTMVNGSPMWSWHVGVFHQMCIFPTIMSIALMMNPEDFDKWLLSPNWQVPAIAFHVCFISYLAKDLPFPMPPLIQVHHVACAIFALISLSGCLIIGHNTFALGAFILELGSGALAIAQIFPNSALINLGSIAGLSASNGLGVVLLMWWAAKSVLTPMIWRIVFPLAGIILAYLRQTVAWAGYKQAGEMLASKASTFKNK